MTFPLTVGPGETGYLANPDQNKYFFWSGNPTSAHYYVNKQGVSEDEACTWAQPGDDRGNWAPAIIGTSWDDINMNQGFSSLKQNELRKDVPLDYSITFTGNGVVSPCKYKKSSDQYCQADDCWSRKEQPDRGCTVWVACTIFKAVLIVRRLAPKKAAHSSLFCRMTSTGGTAVLAAVLQSRQVFHPFPPRNTD
jgi:hypothetical protein